MRGVGLPIRKSLDDVIRRSAEIAAQYAVAGVED